MRARVPTCPSAAQHTPGQAHPPAKITELEDSCVRVHQQVLGLDVTVAHTLGVDVGQAPEELVHVHLGQTGQNSSPALPTIAPPSQPQEPLQAHSLQLKNFCCLSVLKC